MMSGRLSVQGMMPFPSVFPRTALDLAKQVPYQSRGRALPWHANEIPLQCFGRRTFRCAVCFESKMRAVDYTTAESTRM
jgi:hypothetical protein